MVTNPITLSRNSSDPSPQPEAPAGPCPRTTEAEVPTGLPPNACVLRKENSLECLFCPWKDGVPTLGTSAGTRVGLRGCTLLSAARAAAPQHSMWLPAPRDWLQATAPSSLPRAPSHHLSCSPGSCPRPYSPYSPPRHSTGRAIPKTSGPPPGWLGPHEGPCTFGVWSELKNEVRNQSSVRSGRAPRGAADHPGAPSTLQGPTRTKIVLCSTCTNGNLTAQPGCETAPPPR